MPATDEPPRRLVAEDGRLVGEHGEVSADYADMLVLPGAEIAAHWLDLPAGSAAQARAAASFLLAEELAVSEGLHFAVGEPDADGRRLVLVTSAERLRGWLDQAAALGAEPICALPDYLLLQEPAGDGITAAMVGSSAMVRGRELAFTAEAELAETLIAGREIDWIEDARFEAMSAARAAQPEVNLLQGGFAKGAGAAERQGRRRPAMLAAAVLLSPFLVLGAQIGRDELTAHSLRGHAVESARAVAPSARDPVADLMGQVARRRAADQFPGLAADFFRALEAVPTMQATTIVFSSDGALRSNVAYASYSDIDQLSAAAAASGLTVEHDSTITEGDRINSDLVIRRRP